MTPENKYAEWAPFCHKVETWKDKLKLDDVLTYARDENKRRLERHGHHFHNIEVKLFFTDVELPTITPADVYRLLKEEGSYVRWELKIPYEKGYVARCMERRWRIGLVDAGVGYYRQHTFLTGYIPKPEAEQKKLEFDNFLKGATDGN